MFSYTVRVNTIKSPKGKVVAFGSLVIDEVFEVNGFRIVDGANGLFVSPPQHKGKDKEGNDTYYDDARFLGDNREGIRDEIYKTFIDNYTASAGSSTRAATAEAQSERNSTNTDGDRRPLW